MKSPYDGEASAERELAIGTGSAQESLEMKQMLSGLLSSGSNFSSVDDRRLKS